MNEERRIREQILLLEDQHRELDRKIGSSMHLNMLEMQRLKKQKLGLKDQISTLQSSLVPDIIA